MRVFWLPVFFVLTALSADIFPPYSKKPADKRGVTSRVVFSPDIYALEFIQQEDGSFRPSVETITLTFERKEASTFCTKIKEVTASVWGPNSAKTSVEFEQNDMYVPNGNRMEFGGKTYTASTGRAPGFCTFDTAKVVIPAWGILDQMGHRGWQTSDHLKQYDVCARYQADFPELDTPWPVYIDTGYNAENASDSYSSESRRLLVSIRCRRQKPEGAYEVALRAQGKYLGVEPARGFEMRSDRPSIGDTERFWLRPGSSGLRLQSAIGGKYAEQNSNNGQVYGGINHFARLFGSVGMEIAGPGQIRMVGGVWSNSKFQKQYWVPSGGIVNGTPDANSQTIFDLIDAKTGKPLNLASAAYAKNGFSMSVADGSLPGAALEWKLIRVADGAEVNQWDRSRGTTQIEDFAGTQYRMEFSVTYQGKVYRPDGKPAAGQPAIIGIVNANEHGSREKPVALAANRVFSIEGAEKSHWYKVSFKMSDAGRPGEMDTPRPETKR